MPTMSATKRKFNALLQGIGAKPAPQSPVLDGLNNDSPLSLNRPSTPNSIPASGDILTPSNTMAPPSIPSTPSDILSKRRRVGVLETKRNEKTAGTTISNVILKKWTPGGNAVSPSKESKTDPPKYCPGDRDELIRRLGTFQELTEWTPKPDKINEIEWAKRGWVCQGKERVRCTLCHKELVVKTSKTEVNGKEVPVLVGSDIEEALVKRFIELIIDAHQEDCLWRKRGCDGKSNTAALHTIDISHTNQLSGRRFIAQVALSESSVSARISAPTIRRPLRATIVSSLPLQPTSTSESRSQDHHIATNANLLY